MRNFAFFLEGKSELIFTYYLLFQVFDPSDIQIKCIKIGTSDNFNEDFHSYINENATKSFFLINVQGDSSVVTAIKRNHADMLKKYDLIIGLRDLYCEDYDKEAKSKIENTISAKIISLQQNEINKVNSSSKINLYFAVMEIESWFLGFHNAIERLGYSLSKIYAITGYDIRNIDPQTTIYKPKSEIKKFHENIKGTTFHESSFAESISKEVKIQEIEECINSGKLSWLKLYFEKIISI